MRELVYYVAVSLDGFIAGPDGETDAFPVEGDHMRTLLDEFPETLPVHVAETLGIPLAAGRFDTVIMGRNTLAPALEIGVPSPYPHLRQVVATHRPHGLSAELDVTDEPLRTVRELKTEPGADLWLCGGGQLAGSLLPEIDRLILKRNPVTFGSGLPLFGGSAYTPRSFDLGRARAFDSGVVIEEYAAAR
ncbi:dihydrofolate reductase family protein [Microbacterium oleivorans]|uniref:dihydrofolate reductase family protein n=1 Tax=Microbacterium TaxID=33882 RepID=UPI00203BDB66|nr:dihydrofolate reductase family protein [Microbacterium oleivorans]MCM3696003.1 dihydrofolate reductase family protein [Microbacterium oleivorans]